MYHKANKALKTGQYQDALEGYQSLESQGPVIYYNTGIAQYHLQQYGKALASWGKAEQHAGPALLKKIQANKTKAYQKLGIQESHPWRIMALLVQSYFSLFLLQILFLLTWFGWWFADYSSSALVRKYKVVLLLISISCGCLLAVKYWVQEYQRAIVIVSEAKIFAGPNTEFDSVAHIKEGEQVTVVQKEDTWYKVSCQNVHGWIQSVDIEQIN